MQPTDIPSPFDESLALAQKLVALAREQSEALKRGSNSQFEWLVLRRQEVTDRLPRLIAPGTAIPPDLAAEFGRLRDELGTIDAEMAALVRGRMADVRESQAGLRRARKTLGGYLQAPKQVPAFLDTKR